MSTENLNMFGKMLDRVNKAIHIRDFIVANVTNHPTDIARLVIDKFKISRVTAIKHLHDLIQEGKLEATGKTKDRIYSLRELANQIISLTVTPQLQEDVVWTEQIKPLLANTRENVLGICAHGFTEMLNNVIDHSRSPSAGIFVKCNAARIEITVADVGVGIFKKIQTECQLEDIHHAILELAKGKLTTDPDRHSGEGIFFTSRMFDEFMINADGINFMRANTNDWLFESSVKGEAMNGTTVTMEISTDAKQTAKEVFDKYRVEFDDIGFSKTIIPLRLMECEGEKLISRSQAKRLLKRADRFKEVVLDFNGITEIGQAFADEIFRVYRKANPQVHLYSVNAEPVMDMINRASKSDEHDEESLLKNEIKTEQ